MKVGGVSERYDVIVVGARVAGSTLAALLGLKGVRVLVLDQARFPSDTLSTHVIFDDSFSVWEDAGAWSRIQAIGAVEMTRVDWRRTAPDTDVVSPIYGVPAAQLLALPPAHPAGPGPPGERT